MEQNNAESKFNEWLQCQVAIKNTTIITKEVYDEIVKYLKVVNNGNQGYDFPEVIRKRVKHHHYQLMNYSMLNLENILYVPSKDKTGLNSFYFE